MNPPENDPAAAGAGAGDGDDEVEEFSDQFKCCVCLDLIYKPVVLACGHISCFWCVFEAMDTWQESRCPVCRHSFYHFPSICWLLHCVLMKLYPKTYQKRESQVREEEKTYGTFSTQFENYLAVSHFNEQMPSQCHTMGQGKDCSVSESSEPALSDNNCTTTGFPTRLSEEISKNVDLEGNHHDDKQLLITDLLCTICKKLLCRPVVLNCGHVFCETCIIDSHNEPCQCPVCQSLHPKGFPKICLVLEGFLEEHLSEEYTERRATINNLRTGERGSSSTASTQVSQGARCSSVSMDEHVCFSGHKVHFGVGCDCCGMYPLIGDRYKCKDCLEDIGFDLCADCYKSSSKLPGRFNQQHKAEHKFEVIEYSPIVFVEDHGHDDRQENQTTVPTSPNSTLDHPTHQHQTNSDASGDREDSGSGSTL